MTTTGAVIADIDPAIYDRDQAPYRVTHCPLAAPTYFGHYEMSRAPATDAASEQLAAHESALARCERMSRTAYHACGSAYQPLPPGRRDRDIAYEIRRLVSANLDVTPA